MSSLDGVIEAFYGFLVNSGCRDDDPDQGSRVNRASDAITANPPVQIRWSPYADGHPRKRTEPRSAALPAGAAAVC